MTPETDLALDPASFVLVVGAIATALLAIWKVGLPANRWIRRVGARANRALDVVLGQPEVPDPDRPGTVLRPAVPDIGVRVTSIETKLDVAVLHMVERAEASADRAAAAAQAAATDSRLAITEVRELRREVDQWHGVDRAKANLADAAVHEIDQHPPTEP